MTGQSLKLGKLMTNQVINTLSHVWWPSIISNPAEQVFRRSELLKTHNFLTPLPQATMVSGEITISKNGVPKKSLDTALVMSGKYKSNYCSVCIVVTVLQITAGQQSVTVNKWVLTTSIYNILIIVTAN